MLKQIIRIFIAIVKQIAIAFFFASLVILISSALFKEKVFLVFDLLDNFAVRGKIAERVTAEYDPIEKKLIKYPRYGTDFATIIIPDMNFEEKVIHGDSLTILKKNVGHSTSSFFPGEGGTVIICAHNSRKHFMYLPKVKIGSTITLKTDYGTFIYKVYETKVVKDTNEEAFAVQQEKEELILFTCYPTNTVGAKDHRYVVYAELESFEYAGEQNES